MLDPSQKHYLHVGKEGLTLGLQLYFILLWDNSGSFVL